MDGIEKEYNCNFAYMDEPVWIFNDISFFRNIWQSPVFQRRLQKRHLWSVKSKHRDTWKGAIFLLFILFFFICLVAPYLFIFYIPILILVLFLPSLYALIMRIPLRIKSIIDKDNINPVLSTPVSDEQIFEAEIFYVILVESRLLTVLLWVSAITLPISFFIGFIPYIYTDLLWMAIPFAIMFGLIFIVVVLTATISLYVIPAYLSAIFSIHFPLLSTMIMTSLSTITIWFALIVVNIFMFMLLKYSIGLIGPAGEMLVPILLVTVIGVTIGFFLYIVRITGRRIFRSVRSSR